MTVAGTVSRWNEEKGFGFIVQLGTQESIYVHRTGLVGIAALREGDDVEFEKGQDAIDVKRGKERATNVRLVKAAAEVPPGQEELPPASSLIPAPGASPGGCSLPPLLGRSHSREEQSHGPDADVYMPEDGVMSHNGEPPREVGCVKSWYDDKKFGFITPDRGGESIYVHCTGLIGMEFLHEGDTVEFERFQDAHDVKRGKERATNVRLLGDAAGNRTANKNTVGLAYGYGRQNRSPAHQDLRAPLLAPSSVRASLQAPAAVQAQTRTEKGRVSRWNDEKGFGFIVHNGTQESIYVHRTGLIGCDVLREGEEVEYERFQDARDVERGKERAVNVQITRGDNARTSSSSSGSGYVRDDRGAAARNGYVGPDLTFRRPDLAGYGAGARVPSFSPAVPLVPAPTSYATGEVGTVMSWNDDKGFGFILLQGSKESIYCHRTGLCGVTSLREGDTVEFERSQNQKDIERGKERAINVRLYRGGHMAVGRFQNAYRAPVPSRVNHSSYDGGCGPYESYSQGQGERRPSSKGAAAGFETGIVSAWNDEKGFGFIVCEGSKESIYVHRTGLLGAEVLHEGEAVEFARAQDARDVERGKERAVNVRVLSGAVRGGRERSRSPRRR